MAHKFDPEGANIYQTPRGWFAEDQSDWFAGPYDSPTLAAWKLYVAVKDWEDNYEPKETGDAWTGGFADNH